MDDTEEKKISCAAHQNSLEKIEKDVADIKIALVGSDLFPDAIIPLVKQHELEITKIKNRNKIAYGITTGFFILIKFWDNIFKTNL